MSRNLSRQIFYVEICDALAVKSMGDEGVSIFSMMVLALSGRKGWENVEWFLLCDKTEVFVANREFFFVSLPQTLGGFMQYIRSLSKTGMNVPDHLERMDVRVRWKV